MKKQLNKNLHKAKKEKNDEFYTQLPDIEKELKHYKDHFKDKVVYCNCDDHRNSNFFKYFFLNFEFLGLKKLITTCYKKGEQSVGLVYDGSQGDRVEVFNLEGDGDFRSDECVELLRESDIVVTNPPFSLFREYVAQLVEYDKKFLILGSINAITYKEIFPLIKENRMWLGVRRGGGMLFDVSDDYAKELVETKKEGSSYCFVDGDIKAKFGNITWFTNLDHKKRHEKLILYKKYSTEEYPVYDNYNAINVDKTSDIPMDYDGVMGVPITFLDKYNPDQFEILGIANSARWIGYECLTIISGKKIYNRIIIKKI